MATIETIQSDVEPAHQLIVNPQIWTQWPMLHLKHKGVPVSGFILDTQHDDGYIVYIGNTLSKVLGLSTVTYPSIPLLLDDWNIA